MDEPAITLRLNHLRGEDKLQTRDGEYLYQYIRNHHLVNYFKVKAPNATLSSIAAGQHDEELIESWHDAAHMEWVADDTARHDAEMEEEDDVEPDDEDCDDDEDEDEEEDIGTYDEDDDDEEEEDDDLDDEP